MNTSFLTGCDSNTEWQLPWFIENLRKYSEEHLLIADFGMSEEMVEWLETVDNINIFEVRSEAKGWFKKPRAMLDASHMDIHTICWLDTDCQVMSEEINKIFIYTEQGKLSMVEDRPWTKRRGELGAWHNSGVVVFRGSPNILKVWADECVRNPVQGDQEVLHGLINGNDIVRMSWIYSIPNMFNTLRLDYIDGIAVKNPVVVHHTGAKGKEIIKEQIDNVQ